MHKPTCLLLSVVLFSAFSFAQNSSDLHDLNYKFPSQACTEFTFPDRWDLPEERSVINGRVDFLGAFSNFEYRTLNKEKKEIAVTVDGIYAMSANMKAPLTYAFSLEIPSKLRRITDAEWQTGTPFKLGQKDVTPVIHNRYTKEPPKNVFRYKERQFVVTHGIAAAISSPDDRWLLLQGYGGRPQWAIWGDGSMPRSGPFSLEVFATSSARKTFEIRGRFRHGLDPDIAIGDNGWLTDNILAFDPYPSKKKLVICDVSKNKK